MVEKGVEIAPASGKLGILLVGLGAVSTTFVAGVEAIRKGTAEPIGSLTQTGTIRLGKRTDNRSPKIKDFVPLAALEDIVSARGIFSRIRLTTQRCTPEFWRNRT
jgi:myo-inositol-1-phosphate synthase